jgi:DNA-binding XRE family transcriptional regulator
MIKTYLQQLKEIAEETGWKLNEACIDAGISETTYYRWAKGNYNPREKQAKKVAEHMVKFRR